MSSSENFVEQLLSIAIAAALAAGPWTHYIVATAILYYGVSQWRANAEDHPGTPWLIDHGILRETFGKTAIPKVTPRTGHSHGRAASSRASGREVCETFCKSLGLVPYFFQMSSNDQRAGRRGSRDWRWAKDVTADRRVDRRDPMSAVVMVDVDYYIDMPDMMATEFCPYLLYTFVPEKAASADGDYHYTFDSKGRVQARVAGAAQYAHWLWDYGGDHVAVYSWMKDGAIPYPVYSVYLIDRRSISPTHQLILLTPVKTWSGLAAFFKTQLVSSLTRWTDPELRSTVLTRMNPIQGDFIRLEVHTESGVRISTGRVGCYGSATVSASDDEHLADLSRIGSYKLNLSHVQSLKLPDDTSKSVLLDYHLSKMPRGAQTLVYPVTSEPRVYGAAGPQALEGRPMMNQFMSPIIDGAFVPVDNKDNEKWCVEERILKIAPPKLKVTPWMQRVMSEFIELFSPKIKLHPVDVDVVWEKQNRPSQRAILENASMTSEPHRVVKTFMKAEAYLKTSPPRNISTINGNDKITWSQYMYALSDHLKSFDWYAFGRSNPEIAERVSHVCEGAEFVALTDFSRFDGHVSNVIRDFEEKLVKSCFAPEHHEHLEEARVTQVQQNAVGKHKTRFPTGYSRLSGSPETSAFNTIANAFVAFYALRTDRYDKDGRRFVGLPPEIAFASLGIYGGDDGLTANVDVEHYVKCAAQLGFVLEGNVIKRGELGVSFLNRFYGPRVWFGDTNSMCDVHRALSRFHVTPHIQGVTPEQKLVEKARAYSLSDANTPVLGAYCKSVISKSADVRVPAFLQGNLKYRSSLDDAQYPNHADNTWMDYLAEKQLSANKFNIAKFQRWLDNAMTLKDLMTVNEPFAEPTGVKAPKRTIVVDGVLVDPTSLRRGRQRGRRSHPKAT